MPDPEPFHVPVTALDDHFRLVGDILRRFLEPGVESNLGVDATGDRVVAGLDGIGLETTMRNRGRHRARVAPLLQLPDGLWAWLGYQEEWSRSPGRGVSRVFFRSSSIGIHFGFRYMDPKPQIFRAEWAGYDLHGGKYRFQGGRAGHPHWQFDAAESLVSDETFDRAGELAALLREEAAEQAPAEFTPQGLGLGQSDVHGIVMSRKIAAMHFASAARWWSDPAHAHAPSGVQQIRTWIERTLEYVVQELDRV